MKAIINDDNILEILKTKLARSIDLLNGKGYKVLLSDVTYQKIKLKRMSTVFVVANQMIPQVNS